MKPFPLRAVLLPERSQLAVLAEVPCIRGSVENAVILLGWFVLPGWKRGRNKLS